MSIIKLGNTLLRFIDLYLRFIRLRFIRLRFIFIYINTLLRFIVTPEIFSI